MRVPTAAWVAVMANLGADGVLWVVVGSLDLVKIPMDRLQYQHQWVNYDPVCHGIVNWIVPPPKLMYFRPHTQVNTLFSVVEYKKNIAATHQSCISRLVCIEPRACYLSPIEHDVILCFHHCCACFSFSGGLHSSGQIWPQWRSPNMPKIIYISGL